ncbi:MAG: Zn-ribbon domain-containing OB-fold protein [Anaerolineales bacterium]
MEAREPYKFSGRGEIYSFTTVSDAPAEFSEFTPYAVALIRLEEGPLLTAQVTDLDGTPLRIGMPVEMVTRKLHAEGEKGTLVYGYKFRPVLERAA